ncbi:hypothetical protein AB5I39_12325 [Sphingomonas sp. MMS24-J45]|uniref:hypothetical protein n=1 Tax=Sphingomonas sp. MMS24-J45 TaxID=3238806 RepID=UPI00384FA1FC
MVRGALLIRTVEPLGALRGIGVPILYAALFPGTYPFILLAQRIARLQPGQTLNAVAIATMSATFLDGIALMAYPALYGADRGGAGAAILWGGAVGLALALMMDRAKRS